jgi:hypothetical protein
VVVLECRGGSDKGPDGHRRDTMPICEALRQKGWAAEPLFFDDANHAFCKARLLECQGVVVRVNPVRSHRTPPCSLAGLAVTERQPPSRGCAPKRGGTRLHTVAGCMLMVTHGGMRKVVRHVHCARMSI